MNTKAKESQVALSLKIKIALTIILWLGVFGFIGYSLLRPSKLPAVLVQTIPEVPSIDQRKIGILRVSLKSSTQNNTAPIIRPEPFD